MPSRSDQLSSYRFAMRRVALALLARDMDAAGTSGQRSGLSLLTGVLITALVMCGFTIWGLLRPDRSDNWRRGDAVIVERESGARFVFIDGRLHPVANYSSALLILDRDRPAVVSATQRSLRAAVRGAALGIPGAPDSLPSRGGLLRGPWSVCSRPDGSSVVQAGEVPLGGRSVGASGLLVSVPDGTTYLVWNGMRARLREPYELRAMLVWGSPTPVAAALVSGLPAVPDIGRISVPDRGRPFAPMDGVRIGEVLVVDGRQHVVALADGFAPINEFQAALLLGDPATVRVIGQKQATPLSPGEFAVAPKVELPGVWVGLPTTPPSLIEPPDGAVCAVGAEVVVGARPRAGLAIRRSAGRLLADEVYLPSGRGAIVSCLAAPAAPTGTLHLITDLGVRHPIRSPEALRALGYTSVTPVELPAEVVDLLPAGATLDQQAARSPLGA